MSWKRTDPLIDYTDPVQMHGYGYANWSPVTLSDPDGLRPECGPGCNGDYNWNPTTGKVTKTKAAKKRDAKRGRSGSGGSGKSGTANTGTWYSTYVSSLASGSGEPAVFTKPVYVAPDVPLVSIQPPPPVPSGDMEICIGSFGGAPINSSCDPLTPEEYYERLKIVHPDETSCVEGQASACGLAGGAAATRGLGKALTQAAKGIKKLLKIGKRGKKHSSNTQQTLTPSDLNSEQASNLKRYRKKLPAAGRGERTEIARESGGAVRFSTRVPGRVPGSYATYTKSVDSSGKTIRVTKTTVDPNGAVVHVKEKFSR